MLAEGEQNIRDEIHFATYHSLEVFNNFNEDPEFVKIGEEYAMPALEDVSIFTSHNTDFELGFVKSCQNLGHIMSDSLPRFNLKESGKT